MTTTADPIADAVERLFKLMGRPARENLFNPTHEPLLSFVDEDDLPDDWYDDEGEYTHTMVSPYNNVELGFRDWLGHWMPIDEW